jgi:Domain of unknown function (DUF4307)
VPAAKIDVAILADGTDKTRRRGRQVSETRATTPAFPPGRYGRRRDGRRHLGGPIVFGVIVIVVSVLLSVRLYRQYGDPNYDAQIVGWTGVTETKVTIDFRVRVPAGGSATCVLRARSYDGAEVGNRTVTVAAAGNDTTIEASEPVATTAQASVGDVVRCRPPG